jgi:recombination protein RecT
VFSVTEKLKESDIMAPKPQDLTTTGQNTAGTSLTEYIKAQRTAVAKLTGADSREADAYIQEAVTEVWMRPELQSCEKKSIIGACLQAWSLKLHVGTAMGEAALVPYKGKCVFQIMQKGLQTLFYNHESAVHLDARIVYEKDYFDMDLGTAHQLVHKPCLEQDRGKIRGYYAIALMRKIDPSTRLPFEYYVWTDLWTPEQIKAWAHQYSASYRSYESGQSGEKNAWKTSFDGMALKTMKKQLAKTLPMSTTMRKALAADDSIKSFRNDEMNPLDQPDEFDYEKDAPTIIETTAEVVETKEEKVARKEK